MLPSLSPLKQGRCICRRSDGSAQCTGTKNEEDEGEKCAQLEEEPRNITRIAGTVAVVFVHPLKNEKVVMK